MKAIKILGHPIALMSMFLLLMIEGDNFGGFYLLYLLLAAPHGAPYAIVALLGLIAVFTGYKMQRGKFQVVRPVLQLVGLGLMLISLLLFFVKGNKSETFSEAVPLFSFLLFAVIAICFLIRALLQLFQANLDKDQNLDTII